MAGIRVIPSLNRTMLREFPSPWDVRRYGLLTLEQTQSIVDSFGHLSDGRPEEYVDALRSVKPSEARKLITKAVALKGANPPRKRG